MSSLENEERSIFVTVGTTLFDSLIEAVSDSSFLKIVQARKYENLTIQYGNGHHYPISSSSSSSYNEKDEKMLHVNTYKFKPSLDEDMSKATLIISHAGAGSIMEGLSRCRSSSAKKSRSESKSEYDTVKLIVVINSKLMNNHQMELAGVLASRGHLVCVEDPKLLSDESYWKEHIDSFQPVIFPEGDNGKDFSVLVDNCMGFL